MSAPKFKIGDRVKWRDEEGRARKGVICASSYCSPAYYVREAQELKPGLWHESHLSLDVPAPKQFATDNQVALAAEVIQQVFKIAALEKELREANGKIKRFKALVGEM